MRGRRPEAMSWPESHQGNPQKYGAGNKRLRHAFQVAYFADGHRAKSELWSVTVIPLRTNSMYPVRSVHLLHQAPARSAGHNLYLEKISPALSCGRERASLTVSIRKTHSDTEHSVPAHSCEWVCPDSLLIVSFKRMPGDAGAFHGVKSCIFQNQNAKHYGGSLTAAALTVVRCCPHRAGTQKLSVKSSLRGELFPSAPPVGRSKEIALLTSSGRCSQSRSTERCATA
ncbi:hypothetical protein ACVLVH_004487 [Kluyvera sp. 1366]